MVDLYNSSRDIYYYYFTIESGCHVGFRPICYLDNNNTNKDSKAF